MSIEEKDPNINNQMEEDQNEDDLWYDEDYDDYEDEDENYECASNCTCGAWIITARGNVYHVADCCCGAE